LEEDEIRAQYRKRALRDSASFLESYSDEKIEIKYYIDDAIGKGLIQNKTNPNKAMWQNGESIICDISGLKSSEVIAQRIYEFSQMEEGAEFLIQLKAIYK
jgi:hypothetical protein